MSHSNPTERYHNHDFFRGMAMYLGVVIHTSVCSAKNIHRDPRDNRDSVQFVDRRPELSAQAAAHPLVVLGGGVDLDREERNPRGSPRWSRSNGSGQRCFTCRLIPAIDQE